MRSGFVPVVGRPNVGKSTLINTIVGTKVSITSDRPQTTRAAIRGILDREDLQIVFVDTPGFHRPRTALGSRLNSIVTGSLADADAVVFVIDGTGSVGPGDRLIAERLRHTGTPVVCVVNKTDAAGPARTLERLAEAAEWDFAAYVPVSGLTGEQVEAVVEELAQLLPEGPRYFPTGMPTDQRDEFLISEAIREKFLSRLRDELPHSLAVVVDDLEHRDDGLLAVSARVVVERDSQKGIVIGKGAGLLRDAGTEARVELEAKLGRPVHLDLKVVVEKDWQERPGIIERLGL
ncbi:MAG: GTPase Era [Acidimicrobiia bacterium]